MKQLFCIPLILTCALTAFATDDPGRAALEQAGKSGGGVACVTRPECAEAALALAHNKSWAVHLLFADKTQADAVKQKAAAAGLLGRNVFVECAPADRLPHADHLLDLLITTTATPEAEALRVISPIRGRAFVGDKALVKPELPGSDWWTHRVHGADNNPLVRDKVFQLPVMLQYLNVPMYSSYMGSFLASGGVRIELFDWQVSGGNGAMDRIKFAGKLLGRSLYNGQILWERELPHKIKPDSQICAVEDGRVYIAGDEGCSVQVIDAATGSELPPVILAPDTNRHVTWLSVQNGKLYALFGDRNSPQRPGPVFAMNYWTRQWNDRTSDDSGKATDRNKTPGAEQAATGVIVCHDIKTGRLDWRHDEPALIDFRVIAMRDGRVYFYSENTRLACLDAQGKLAWENRDKAWLEPMSDKAHRDSGSSNLRNSSTLIVGPTVLAFNLVARSVAPEGYVFGLLDGKLLWKIDKYQPTSTAFSDDGVLWSGKAFSPETGKILENTPWKGFGGYCGYRTYIPAVGGMVGHCSFNFKNPCNQPIAVAGGVLSFLPSLCNCGGGQHGAGGYVSGSSALSSASGSPGHPMESGGLIKASLKAAPGDWPQHRGDARHLGANLFATSKNAELRPTGQIEHPLAVPVSDGQSPLDWLDRPTPPVTAGGMAFYGLSDGRLRAVRIADGKEAWTYWTGAPVLTTPVVAKGRLYAGSCDGWAYCLDAATGTLIWRWRGAPSEHSMMTYGKLISSWPVVSLMAGGDTLYGVAGLFSLNGAVLFALDIASGKPKWTQWIPPVDPAKNSPAYGYGGYLALVGNNLRPADYAAFPGVIDGATGLAPQAGSLNPTTVVALSDGYAQDCIAVSEQLVFRGGNPLLENPDPRQYRYAGILQAYPLDQYQGKKPVNGSVVEINRCIISPAISDEEIAVVGGLPNQEKFHETGGLSLWKRDIWESLRQQKIKNPKLGGVPLDMKQAKWFLPEVDANAVVLGKDAVLAVVGMMTPEEINKNEKLNMLDKHSGFSSWKLSAFNRADGKEIWSILLPGEPVFNGLAPAADGSWVLTLRDGNLAIVTAKIPAKENP